MTNISEGVIEEACLGYFASIGYQTCFGPEIGPGGNAQEREDWHDVVLVARLRQAVEDINPDLPKSAIDEVISRVLRAESQNPMAENLRVHKLLSEGVPIEFRDDTGDIKHDLAWIIDFENPEKNDYLVVNQLTVIESGKNRRPDVIIYVNGIPVGLIELKNPGDESATIKGAWNQIQTYRNDIPTLFSFNAVCIASDGLGSVMSSFSAGFEHFAPWKTIDGKEIATDMPQLEVMIRGVFEPVRFLDLLRNFIVHSDEQAGLVKRVAKYHQYWAVNEAVESTIEASGENGDRRGGVVWHTQGSGKSFEMLCYSNKMMRSLKMQNPTLVILTDRNDLDDQLFDEVFAPAKILPETPQQATSRADLREMLTRSSGGIIFTTIQKFAPDVKSDPHPELSSRRNVVVIADEAHRSQYDFLDGYARHLRDALPNATYIGFTGTPIESADRSTRQIFGDYIDIYDLTRAVEDGATVRIYYESRLAKVELPEKVKKGLDDEIDRISEGQEKSETERAKSKWARLEAIVGAEERLDLIAADIIDHWEKRKENLFGKAMIVCMSRRICVRLYEKIVQLRPSWHSDDPLAGRIKVVMTGSAADPQEFQPHLYPKDVLRSVKTRAKNPEDPLELVIVRDMWLTGFDSPSMNTMYVDKPMQSHSLMQAIARVNRTFRDKPGGLIVDYIGIAQNIREALVDYSPSDRNQAGIPIGQMIEVMLEKHDIICGILHDHEWSSDPRLSADKQLLQLQSSVDYILADLDRKARFLDQVLALIKSFALAGASSEALAIRNDVKFFTDIRSYILKLERHGSPDGSGRGGSDELDTAIAQLVSEAVSGDSIVDIYAEAGIERPELSILSDDFLKKLTLSDKPNLQMELLKK
ncbi:MAG: type I restriction endonuclease subunit R, partial [Acidimicrobiales bacterium]|nr:type I restriction endonuclease subunit R [Acidimicrobiales bacterium]